MADEKQLLNDWGGLISAELRRRPSGKERFTLSVKSEAVSVHLDAKRLGKPVADALAIALRNAISGIAARVSDATADYRLRAQRAYREGATWALRRYQARGGAGLRGAARQSAERFAATGPHEPNADQQYRLLSDSGHFARSIVARPAMGDRFIVNVSTRRMDTPLVRERVMAVLNEHVPAFGNPRLLGDDKAVQDAVVEARQLALAKESDASRQALLDALSESAERVQELAEATSEFGEE